MIFLSHCINVIIEILYLLKYSLLIPLVLIGASASCSLVYWHKNIAITTTKLSIYLPMPSMVLDKLHRSSHFLTLKSPTGLIKSLSRYK